MPGPVVTRQNVLVGQAGLRTAPEGTAFPLDTLALDAAWLAPWVPAGATEEGLSFNVSTETSDVTIEEQVTPVFVGVDSKDIGVETVLSEDTLEVMKLVYGGGEIATVAAGVGQPGKKTLTLSNELETLALGFEGVNKLGMPRRVFIPSVLSIADTETVYRRASDARRYKTTFRVVCDPSEIEVVDIVAAATA